MISTGAAQRYRRKLGAAAGNPRYILTDYWSATGYRSGRQAEE